jgi:hypothetical protein
MAAKKKASVAKPAALRKKKAVGTPQRRIRKAASNVHDVADRARELGDAVIQAGELIKVGANIADMVADRVVER